LKCQRTLRADDESSFCDWQLRLQPDTRIAYIQTGKDKKGDLVFLGGENFNPASITNDQWCNLHHHFIDISSGNRENLVSVIGEPVERARFLEALHHNGPFQPLGCSSTFGEARDRMENVLKKLATKENLTQEDRDLALHNIPCRGYNPIIPLYEIMAHAALSGAVNSSANTTYCDELHHIFD
jgi:hypothetical protein